MNWEWLGTVLLRGIAVGLIAGGLGVKGARAWALMLGLAIALETTKGA